MIDYFLLLVIGYLIGSIPFSYIVPKIVNIDIRKVGSGNVGGTNVMRKMGGIIGFATMFMDGFKSFIPMIIGRSFFDWDIYSAMLFGFAVCIGHIFPIFLKFKGGKGVACTIGTFTAINGLFLPIFLLFWFPITILSKYVSVSSLTSLAVITALAFEEFGFWAGLIFFGFLILNIIMHRSNIRRLLNDKENKTDVIKAFKKFGSKE